MTGLQGRAGIAANESHLLAGSHIRCFIRSSAAPTHRGAHRRRVQHNVAATASASASISRRYSCSAPSCVRWTFMIHSCRWERLESQPCWRPVMSSATAPTNDRLHQDVSVVVLVLRGVLGLRLLGCFGRASDPATVGRARSSRVFDFRIRSHTPRPQEGPSIAERPR